MIKLDPADAIKRVSRLEHELGRALERRETGYYKGGKEAFLYRDYYISFRKKDSGLEIGLFEDDKPANAPIVFIGLGSKSKGGVLKDGDGTEYLVRRLGLGGKKSVNEEYFERNYFGDCLTHSRKKYVKICSLNDLYSIPDALCNYAQACHEIRQAFRLNKGESVASNSANGQASSRLAFDPGQNVSFSRDGHSVDPQHAKIVIALKGHLEKIGWSVMPVDDARPDLLMKKDGEIWLFEVKPDISNAAIFMAVGQLLTYGMALGAPARRFLVRPAGDLSENLSRVLRATNICEIQFKCTGANYQFC